MHSGEDLCLHPPRVGAEDPGAGGRVEGLTLQGGFHPEARKQEGVVEEDEGKIKYNKTNKKYKKNTKHKNKKNPKIQYNKKDNGKVPLTMITVNANGMKHKVEKPEKYYQTP